MQFSIDNLLDHYRKHSQTEREKGTYFELLCREWLKIDPVQQAYISECWLWSDWAAEQGRDRQDIGVDLVLNCEIKRS